MQRNFLLQYTSFSIEQAVLKSILEEISRLQDLNLEAPYRGSKSFVTGSKRPPIALLPFGPGINAAQQVGQRGVQQAVIFKVVPEARARFLF